jgi:uncharacterized protein YidB (DUF937 family)
LGWPPEVQSGQQFKKEIRMSFLEDIASSGVTSVLSKSSNPLASSVLEMINQHPGGLAGLIQTFHEKGLGDIVSSWVGTGQNLPISSEQIQQVLSSQQVQNLAAKAGISPETLTSQLSTLLPSLVDKVTPNGSVPTQEGLLQSGMDFLKSFGSKTPAA